MPAFLICNGIKSIFRSGTIIGGWSLLKAAVAMKLEATLGEISSTIHAHPSLSEALVEAALEGTGEALYFLSPGRQT